MTRSSADIAPRRIDSHQSDRSPAPWRGPARPRPLIRAGLAAHHGPVRLLWSILAGLGGLFVAAALVIALVSASFFSDAEHTTGRVVALRHNNNKGMAAPVVAYTARDGRERIYQSSTYTNPPYEIGATVDIAYDPAAPDSAALDTWTSRWLLPTIFGGIGSVHLVVGLLGLLTIVRRKREIARLLREGQRVDAELVGAEQDTRIRVNRRHPYVLRLQATLPGEAAPRTFTSRRFWYDPSPLLPDRTLPVFYDPRDPKRHVVDTGQLRPRR